MWLMVLGKVFSVLKNKLLPVLVNNWKIVIPVIIFLVLLWKLHTANNNLDIAAAHISSLHTELDYEKEQLMSCNSAITDQNNKIQEASDISKKNLDAMSALAKVLDTVKIDQKKVIDGIRNTPAPKTCDETKLYLKNGIQELTK